MINNESDFFLLSNGQYIMSKYTSQRFSAIMEQHPHSNFSIRWDEMSMAELFADVYKDDTRFCKEHKTWYTFVDGIWERDTGGLIASERLKEFVRLLHLYCGEIQNDDEKQKNFYKFTAQLSDRRVRDRMLKDASSVYPIFAGQFDNDPYLINCKNGTYNLKNFTFYEPDPNDFLTKKTNFEFTVQKDLKFPRWDTFVSEIMCNDAEMIDFLQRALGYSILGKANEECMFIAYGASTRNGKGTLFNTIYYLLGDYARAPKVAMLCKGKFDSDITKPNPALCSLQGARFATLSEPPENAMLDEETIKNYTGGDPISTRQLYGEAFTFIPQFKMWLSCNTLPSVSDKTIFTSDRIKLVEFNRHFDESERDTTLKSQFLEEDAMRYIFLWLVEGYKKYLKTKLKQPNKMRTAISSYERENDKVAAFYEELCVAAAEHKDIGINFYNAYKNWCKINGFNAKGSTNFYKEFDRFGERVKPQGTTYYKGIKLRTSTIKI